MMCPIHSFSISDRALSKLGNLILEKIGLELSNGQKMHLLRKVSKRLYFLELPNFESYILYLDSHPREISHFINLATNLSTRFFREAFHFDYLRAQVWPEFIKTKKKIRIWSAGCSTGEEPYSIAITLYESIPNMGSYDIKILATDINTEALEIAKKGLYGSQHLADLDSERQKWFHAVSGNGEEQLKIDDKLKKLISFKKLNFLEPWPMRQGFDLILCRNVTIYFNKALTQQLFSRFRELLEIGGILMLGHSESLYDPEHFVSLGQTMYKRIA